MTGKELTGIVIPVHNQWPYVQRMLRSLFATEGIDRDTAVWVIDNASDEQTQQGLARWEALHPALIVHRLEENAGWVGGINAGTKFAQAANCDWIVWLNSDVEFPQDAGWWLSDLLKPMQKNKEIGAVAPVSNYVMGLQNFAHQGLPERIETTFLVFFAVALRGIAVKEVGLLDEKFKGVMNDDLDYSIRLADAGWKMLIERKVFLTHYGSKTLNATLGAQGLNFMDAQRNGRAKLNAKHGWQRVEELWPQATLELEKEEQHGNAKQPTK